MACSKPKIIVTDLPPWYTKMDHLDVFTCEETRGLFECVITMMLDKQRLLAAESDTNWYQTKTKQKLMKNAIIQDIAIIKQKPSKALLIALMDIVDIEGGNDLECVLDDDKAGLKQLLLALSNYTLFYIPQKEFTSRDGRKVIPVVTHYSQSHNLRLYDKERSMIGTYMVNIPGGTSYFMQQVLFVPGYESLELLRRVTGNRYDFWDLALEVPTHVEAVTPGFQQIQPSQLLKPQEQPEPDEDPANKEENSKPSDSKKPKESNKPNLVIQDEQSNDGHKPSGGKTKTEPCFQDQRINPMCCILDTVSANRPKREGSRDYFDETQIKYDLSNFTYANSNTKTVYFRRTKRLHEGKRVNLVSVIRLRKEQLGGKYELLYISTTLRFCRALKLFCMKGNGELVSSCHDTLKELSVRPTFLSGTEIYQDIHNPALTVFNKRVCPTAWCNSTPKHVESAIDDPIMVETVDLGIKLMDNKIPNAFAAAELLYCPSDKVGKYIQFYKYTSDKTYRRTVNKQKAVLTAKLMHAEWMSLMKNAEKYTRTSYPDNTIILKQTQELFAKHTAHTANKIQKTWQTLVNHEPSKFKDKQLVQLFSKVKVGLYNIRVYNKSKKVFARTSTAESNEINSGSSSSQR